MKPVLYVVIFLSLVFKIESTEGCAILRKKMKLRGTIYNKDTDE